MCIVLWKSDFAVIINNKQAEIIVATPSNGQVVYREKNGEEHWWSTRIIIEKLRRQPANPR